MIRLSILPFILILIACPSPLVGAEPLVLESPDGRLRLSFSVGEDGEPAFRVAYRHRPVASGVLGLEFAGSGRLGKNLKIVGVRRASRDETYAIPVGKASMARDQHRELIVSLQEQDAPRRKLNLSFRAFDDAVAFRYLIPQQESLAEFILTDERTRFTFPGDPKARLLPLKGYTTPYEWYYETLAVSEIGPKRLLGLPFLLERPAGDSKTMWIAVTEANLTDYAGMYLSGIEGQPAKSGRGCPLRRRSQCNASLWLGCSPVRSIITRAGCGASSRKTTASATWPRPCRALAGINLRCTWSIKTTCR